MRQEWDEAAEQPTMPDALAAWCERQIGRAALEGRYIIARPLPCEAPGAYFVAREAATGADVTLRLLHWRAAPGGAALVRLRHDLRRAAGSPHPHIVRVWDHSATGGMLALATEAHGTSLCGILARRRIGLPEALQIAQQVGAALAFAHAHGVAHGLLTPAAVELAPSGTARVNDFGLAQVASALQATLPGDRGARPGYFPPEAGREPATPLTDIFHLGALLWEMALGTPPAPRVALALLPAHVELPEPLHRIISACMQPRPADRPHDLADVLGALRAASQLVGGRPFAQPARRAPIAVSHPNHAIPPPEPPTPGGETVTCWAPDPPAAKTPTKNPYVAAERFTGRGQPPSAARSAMPGAADDAPSHTLRTLTLVGALLAALAVLFFFGGNRLFTAHAAPPHHRSPTPPPAAVIMMSKG
jgi:serine/threonine protein kinase